MKYSKMAALIAIFTVFMTMPGLLFSDSPASNMPHKVYSADKQFYVDMIPQDGWGGYGNGKGTVYQVLPDGQAKELWSVPFFAADIVLTNDGKYLIAFGPWATSTEDLALSFYGEGKELKKYAVKDLIRDESRLQRSVSHFFWRSYEKPALKGLSEDQNKFTLTLIDGTTCVFDLSNGDLLTH